MTEDARPIPDPLARELRALNDLELGAVIADLGVDPLKPPGAKLRGALASIAEDADPWWEGSMAGHAVDCLAKEPRRGRIAGGGAVDHARATWEGLARLGAAARLLIPDHDREGEAAGVRSVIGAMEAELRAIRDFTGRADPVEGCQLLADEVHARGVKLADERRACDQAGAALIEIGRAAGTIGTGLPWADLARATVAEIGKLREAAAGIGRLAAAAGLAQREVDAARRSLGCPDGVALSEWVARTAPERAADALIASRDAALAREADAVAELLRWRQWAVKVAPESAEGTNDGLRGRVGWLVVSHRERAATEEAARRGLAAVVEALGDAARDALVEAQTSEIPPGAAERVALLARRYRELRERLGREGLLAALERLAEARDELRRWRSWAGPAGRLPPAALLAARGDDGELRAAIDTALSTPEIGAEAIASLREIAALVRDA